MALDLLDTPVRLTWDLHGPGRPLKRPVMQAIADRIAEAGVFYVTLEERPLIHPALPDILRTLMAAGCRVELSCTGSDAELAALETLPAPRPGVTLDVTPFLHATGVDVFRLHDLVQRLRRQDLEPTLCLLPMKSNIHVISVLLTFCRESGIKRFKLPNARIGDTFRSIPAEELPRWADLEPFRTDWHRGRPVDPGPLQIEIHDRFLWEIMTPDNDQARSEYGGCQAANSLGHVDASGNVYACAAWPTTLGSLCTASLDQIWQSPERYAVRERIGSLPVGCTGCRDATVCLGGCRGLGELLGRDGGGRDLMCRGPRC